MWSARAPGPEGALRRYREGDLQALVRLFTDAVHRLAGGYYTAAQLAAWAPQPPDLNGWTARLASLETLVAEIDGELAGFIAYEADGHIDLLYTSPAYCGRGVAAALFRQAEAELARRGITELYTEASLAARGFFEHRGFRIVEEQQVQRNGVVLQRYAMRRSAD